MDNFKTIYMILKAMDKAIDSGIVKLPSADELKITPNRYYALLIAIIDAELVDGITYKYYLGQSEPEVLVNRPRLTLKGFQYLAENSTIAKVKEAIEGTIEIGTKFLP